MAAILCSPAGRQPSRSDLAVVEQVRAALARRTPSTGPMDPYFDGDVHLVAPAAADRTAFVVVDGRLELP